VENVEEAHERYATLSANHHLQGLLAEEITLHILNGHAK
jgi:hypothetical protein